MSRSIRWSRRILIGGALLALLCVGAPASGAQALPRAAAPTLTPRELPFFGPQKYVRTTGSKDVYTATIKLPKWLVGPFRLHVQNGEADGTFRVSSATINVNGTDVAVPNDFSKTVAALDRTVTFLETNTLTVTLASEPSSYLLLTAFATSADSTAPQLTWVQPAAGSTINSARPHILIRYADAAGTGEPAASGVDTSTLKVLIDNVDRTTLFVRRSDEATADIPSTAALAPGLHTFKATLSDFAGNPSEVTGEFRVDLTPPQLSVLEPAAGVYLPSRTPVIRLHYSDDVALDLASLQVLLNGVDRSALFTKSASEAVIAWNGVSLPEGPVQLAAKIRDKGGNEATASLTFSIDVTAPRLTIAEPAAGARFGTRTVTLTLAYTDEQALDLTSVKATLDGTNVALTVTADGATAQLTGLADGSHTVNAQIADRAGNVKTATAAFTVDTTVPVVKVVQPPAGANIRTATPLINVSYADSDGLDLNSLKITLNGVDRSTLFARDDVSATAQVSGFTLPEGVNEVIAEIRDLATNLGKTISTFFVDTIAPTGTIDAPAARVNSSAPTLTVHYDDGTGSGVDPTSVTLFVDGVDRTALVAATEHDASAVLALTPPLGDGQHTVKVTFADRADNATTLTRTFVIDTKAPVVAIVNPANDSFINTAIPALRVTYADLLGTGVDLATFKLFLRKGTAAETDITAMVTAGAAEATGIVPDESKLADGTYHLRAELRDLAGNVGTAEASFEVDTVAPTYQVESPAPNGYVNSALPQFVIRYTDELSGVDTARAVIKIDGVDKTARFTFTDSTATGKLKDEEVLAEGAHSIAVTLYDRAGNKAPETPKTFTVDTINPTAAVDAPPNGSYVGKPPYAFAVHYGDGTGSGIDPASVHLLIDGTDRTAEFTVAATGATASIATALADGSHTLTVTAMDWAANVATATSTFTVDGTAPSLQITAPAANSWLKGPTIAVSGTVQDNSPVSVEVNGLIATLASGAFNASVPVTDGAFVIHAIARDAAGNVTTVDRTVNVDSVAPVITITAPAANFVTKLATAHITGTVADASAVTLTLNAQPLPLTGTSFAADVDLTAEGKNDFAIVATDAAGNSATKTVSIVRDTVAPTVTVASPAKGSVVGANPVLVRGTAQDATALTVTVDGTAATVTGEAFEASIDNLTEGPHVFQVVATDAAGNATTKAHDVTVDLKAPIVVISSPAAGSLTKNATIDVTGTATDVTLVSVTSTGITATLADGAAPNEKTFTLTAVPLTAGDNTVKVTATDALSRTTEATVLVTRDSTPPSLEVSAPDVITRSRGAHVTATADDNLGLKNVVFKLNGTVLATQTAAPFAVDVTVPATAVPGDTLTLVVVATDKAGNATTVTKTLRVIAEGAVVGQVLSDSTSLPIRGARVRVAGSDRQVLTDDRGRYGLPATDSNLVIVAESADPAKPMTSVERTIAVQSGVGTIPVDARLTPLATAVSLSAGGGTLVAPGIVVTVPANAVSATTPGRLTSLSSQGLPNLLPLGWTPVVAFNVRVEGTLAAPLPFDAAVSGLPAVQQQLVEYKPSMHAWVLVQANMTPSGGTLHAALPEPATYALATTDSGVPAATVGDPIKGVDVQVIPDAATSSGNVTPATLPPTGGSAAGRLIIKSPTPLPSGTVVQAEVTETFTLSSGQVASEEKRKEDIVLFRNAAGDLQADFPIVPSRTFSGGDLVEGKVHLDILAGRESVRGKTGGAQALTLGSGTASISVPAGSLPEDSAISFESVVLSGFLPSNNATSPIAEMVLDFGGLTLGSDAELSVPGDTVGATDTVVVVRIDRVQGMPKVIVVAGASRVGNRFVSQPLAGFDGIRRDGRYAFYRVGVPWSTVTGTIGIPAGAGAALVQTAALPFVAVTDATGHYALIAPIGSATITASIVGTSLAGSATAQVTAGQSAVANISLTATATTATVTPANGALHVPVSAQVEITATAPLNGLSVNASTIVLRSAAGTSVPMHFVLSSSGRVAAAIPNEALAAGTTYTLSANGLTDIYGGIVSVPAVTFSTQQDVPPSYDTNRVVFSMPDSNGMVTVSAPAGSLPPGTTVLIVNSGNGAVVSFTAGNDGSVSGQLPATIEDRLLVTITDPAGNVVNFERSKYVFNDGSGRVAVGPAGGTVEGTGGTGLIIPDGALERGTIFKVELVAPDVYPERPEFPNTHYGSTLRVTTDTVPTLNKEVKLIFPKPADAPEGAFYYVYKRLTGPNGMVGFQTLDYALPDGKGNLVTASPPYIGWGESVSSWQWTSEMENVGNGIASSLVMQMIWSFDALIPGRAISGAVSGRVVRPVFKAGATEPVFEGVQGAMVVRGRENGVVTFPTFALTDKDGVFTVEDPLYTGGTVQVVAAKGSDTVSGTAFEANPLSLEQLFSSLLVHHRHVANITLTMPPQSAPPATPDVEVHLFTIGADGKRQEVKGIAIANVPLIVGFKVKNGVNATILGATIAGEERPVVADNSNATDATKMNFILAEPYIPTAAGTYVLHASALNPLGGPAIDVDSTFLVIAAGGGNNTSVPGAAPDWITARLVPKQNEVGVPLDAVPEIAFTEPVINVMDNLTFTSAAGAVPVTVSAVSVDSFGGLVAIADLKSVPSNTPVVSITVRPNGGLDLNTQYTLQLNGGITDLDKDAAGNPAPKHFPGRTLKFTSIAASKLGSVGGVDAANVVILGSHAYVADQSVQSINQFMTVWDISDPVTPKFVSQEGVSGKIIDIAGDAESPVTNGPVVAVGSGLKFTVPGPSNFYLYDVKDPGDPKRIAVVSLTESAQQGTVLRLSLHNSFAYTVTYPFGVQVIDLQRAVKTHADAFSDPVKAIDASRAIVTEGVGFGQDAVVNSIPISNINGALNHVLDLQADEYNVGGVTKTMVIATGTVPLLVIDPAKTGSAALRATNVPANAVGALKTGRAIGLTTVNGRRFAVIAGTGTPASGGADIPVIALVDITNPLSPVLTGIQAVPDQPLDIVVNDSRAVVSTASRSYVFSIVDPAHPRQIGVLDGAAGRIAFDADGTVVVSTLRDGTKGLHVSLLHPILVVDRVDPIRTKVGSAEGTVTAPQTVVVDEDVKVHVHALPAGIATAATLLINNPRFPDTNGNQPPDSPASWNVTFDSEGNGEITINKNLEYQDTYLLATATATTTTGGQMRSLPRRIALGWVKLTVDSNNSTDIDSADREAARKGRAFGFWESDRNYVFKRIAKDNHDPEIKDPPDDDPMKGMADYFTVRVTVNKPWKGTGDGTVRMHITSDFHDAAKWTIVRKMDPGKVYLSNAAASERQKAEIVGESPDPDKIPACSPTATRVHDTTTECAAQGLNGYVTLPKDLPAGDNDFLIRCEDCMNRNAASATTLTRLPKIWLDYFEKTPSADGSSEGVRLDEAKADIRPVRQWITYMNVRPYQSGGDYRPLYEVDPNRRPIGVDDDEPPGSQQPFANEISDWSTSSTRVPPKARDITVLVHGYNVTDSAMRNKFAPTYLKRLYWVGHPILRTQGEWRKVDDAGNGCVKNCAHAVAISWPSNYPGAEPGERRFLAEGAALVTFPEDEYRAFTSGPAVAKYLRAVYDALPGRKIRVVAHSLGNLLVNSAISRPELAGKVIDTYVMNEAAMPAEAMSADYLADSQILWGEPHAQVYGWPTDAIWQQDWQWMGLTPLRTMWNANTSRMIEQTNFQMQIQSPQDFYERRWRQIRAGQATPPDFDPTGQAPRGPWSGYFHNNESRVGRLFNTFSENDQVLTVVWRGNQLEQKPLSRLGRLVLERGIRAAYVRFVDQSAAVTPGPALPSYRSQDNPFTQNWALLNETDRRWDAVFNDTNEHWTIKRQWAELSMWFPSTSKAAGAVALEDYLTSRCKKETCSTRFTKYSGSGDSALPTPETNALVDIGFAGVKRAFTHSYLGYGKFTEVYPAFNEIRKMFDTND
jgi:hypothetical protein